MNQNTNIMYKNPIKFRTSNKTNFSQIKIQFHFKNYQKNM